MVEDDLLQNSLHLESKSGRNNFSASKTRHSKGTNIHTEKMNVRNYTYVMNKKFRAEFIKHDFNCCFTVHFDKYKTILPTNALFIRT